MGKTFYIGIRYETLKIIALAETDFGSDINHTKSLSTKVFQWSSRRPQQIFRTFNNTTRYEYELHL